jgi:hypothetical protein
MGMAVVALVSMTAGAWAAPVAIVNPGFETDLAADPDGATALPVTGWAAVGEGFGTRQIDTFDPGPLGGAGFAGENNYFRLQMSPNAGGPLAGVSFGGGGQTVPTTIMANAIYTLSVQVANDSRNPFPAIIPADDVYVGFGGGPTVLARLVNVAGGSVGLGETAGVTLVSTSPVPGPGGTVTWTRVYQTNSAPANLGGALFLQLFNQTNTAGGVRQVMFDNVTLDVVPEPCSIALLGLGGVAMTCLRRRGR